MFCRALPLSSYPDSSKAGLSFPGSNETFTVKGCCRYKVPERTFRIGKFNIKRPQAKDMAKKKADTEKETLNEKAGVQKAKPAVKKVLAETKTTKKAPVTKPVAKNNTVALKQSAATKN